MSRSRTISIPSFWIALIAVSLPGPGPLTYTAHFSTPYIDFAFLAASEAAL
jgi:hypothetical protein